METEKFEQNDIDSVEDLTIALAIENKNLIDENKRLLEKLQQYELDKRLLTDEQNLNKINASSTTSSKPPSQDWSAQKPHSMIEIKKMVDEYTGKKPEEMPAHRGKQPNTKGHGKKLPQDCEKSLVMCLPSACQNCENKDSCPNHVIATRHVSDMTVTTTLTTYRVCERKCPKRNGEVLSGTAPDGVNSTFQYGIFIRIFILLCSFFGMSCERTHIILKILLGENSPSVGTIHNVIVKFGESNALKQTRDIIFEILKNKHGVLHADETGIRGNKKNFWLHVICDKLFSYCFISNYRGYQAMLEGGTALLKHNIVVHDCFVSYFKIDGIIHALCNAHIVRDLAGIYIYYKQKWAIDMIILLIDIYNKKNELIEKGITKFDQATIDEFKSKFLKLAQQGIDENPLPDDQKDRKRPKRSKPLRVASRLMEYIDYFLAFAENFDIPFSNNIAERTIRGAKIKIKNSGYLEEKGAKIYAYIYSVLNTCMKQKMDLSSSIRKILNGEVLQFPHYA